MMTREERIASVRTALAALDKQRAEESADPAANVAWVAHPLIASFLEADVRALVEGLDEARAKSDMHASVVQSFAIDMTAIGKLLGFSDDDPCVDPPAVIHAVSVVVGAREELATVLAAVRADVGAELSREGCSCACEHHEEDHSDECERCFACRVQACLPELPADPAPLTSELLGERIDALVVDAQRAHIAPELVLAHLLGASACVCVLGTGVGALGPDVSHPAGEAMFRAGHTAMNAVAKRTLEERAAKGPPS